MVPFKLPVLARRWLSLLAAASRSPLAWVLAGTAVLHGVGLLWGLPASDGWDNDGIAPRDYLAGLVETAAPGKFFQYPPMHLALLALLTAPLTIVELVRAPSLAAPDVVREMIQVPTMTSLAVAARLVSLAMSVGIAWSVARIAEELRGRRAAWCAAAFLCVNAPLTYYAHTTNLDVPYLFWGSLALLALVRAVTREEPRLLRRWAVLAAIAVATKDQAYALFLLAAPVAVGAWGLLPASRPKERAVRAELLRESALAVVLGASLVLAIDGALYNPHGFAAPRSLPSRPCEPGLCAVHVGLARAHGRGGGHGVGPLALLPVAPLGHRRRRPRRAARREPPRRPQGSPRCYRCSSPSRSSQPSTASRAAPTSASPCRRRPCSRSTAGWGSTPFLGLRPAPRGGWAPSSQRDAWRGASSWRRRWT